MPIGPVSLRMYDELYTGRKFDRYGKMVSTKLSAKQQLLANLSNTLAGQVEGEIYGFELLWVPDDDEDVLDMDDLTTDWPELLSC